MAVLTGTWIRVIQTEASTEIKILEIVMGMPMATKIWVIKMVLWMATLI